MKTRPKKKALAVLIICTLLYIASLWPLFYVSMLLLMSIAVSDTPIVYLTLVAYLLSILIAAPRAIYLYFKQKYQSVIKISLIPLLFAILFVLAFYFIAMRYEG